MAQRSDESIDQYRARRRVEEQRRRDNPVTRDRMKAAARVRYADGGRERQQNYYVKLKLDFFGWRARLWSSRWRTKVSAAELRQLWQQQGGRCTLSGRWLGEDAHLDHIVPVSAGGSHEINNLRWLDPFVNVARGAMSDHAFISLCHQICEHQVGRRIQALGAT